MQSKQPKRYWIDEGGGFNEAPDGDWVLATDYEALEARVKVLERVATKAIKKMIKLGIVELEEEMLALSKALAPSSQAEMK